MFFLKILEELETAVKYQQFDKIISTDNNEFWQYISSGYHWFTSNYLIIVRKLRQQI